MTPVILLAAGASTRMGQPKGLVLVNGQFWLTLQLERLYQFGLSPIVLVLGFKKELYFEKAPWVAARPTSTTAKIHIAENLAPQDGPFSSLQAGLKCLPEGCGSFVMPIDVPIPDATVFAAMSQQAQNSAVRAVVPVYQGRRGHPVWLAKPLLSELRLRDPHSHDSRLDHILRGLPAPQIIEVAVQDSRVTLNLNSPEDFDAFARSSEE